MKHFLVVGVIVLAAAACDGSDEIVADPDEAATSKATPTAVTTSSSPSLAVVPDVLAKNLRQAKRILEKAGFEVDVRLKKSRTEQPGYVWSQIPQGGREVRPDRVVELVVIRSGCTPGYSPCIPQGMTDVDCIGEGEGPRYTGAVRVTGLDVYELDPDDDGIGCA